MKLEEYAQLLNKLVEEGYGQADIYISQDEEGNGFYLTGYGPEVRVLPPWENAGRPDVLLPDFTGAELEEWMEEHDVEKDELDKIKRVVLL